MPKTLIKNAKLVNEGKIFESDLLINGQFIEKIESNISADSADQIIDADGNYLLPGLIDDQVHFREPGLTHKANIFTESRAAVAGGVTSFMEMPNTVPNTLTQELLADKYAIGAKSSLANYSFFMGASNDNLEEVLKTNPKDVCGVKVFMGSSTGNMLVDDEKTLEGLFSNVSMLIATHCEDEDTIRKNTELYKQKYGEDVPMECHPLIRSEEACYLSSSMAASLAKKHGTRLHILHISTEKELMLFDNSIPLADKKLTSEACIHHLWFNDSHYKEKGALIKWNPAVKKESDQKAILQAVLDDRIDVIATDHAPHTIEEKSNKYFNAPSGGPLVQHSLVALLEMYHQGKISLEKIIEKASHNVAVLFQIEKRGYIREGYFADLVLVNLNNPWEVSNDNILAKCGWSPFEGTKFQSQVTHTFISGHLAYENGKFDESQLGMRLTFNR
ncbi:dihydroorotase [Fulvivirga lutea]|uniref:Dihydroorotase n=1 Tax=Fulvivirga lutea TaxID=2810512 RepID=A0A975A136_9BACT|nr:dihydroorotase [Fulvivirga lutea]QSE97881.1 dihydroorotase [Fulvivirga lutea]